MSGLKTMIARVSRAFVDAFERSMELSGRSTRTDFWGFSLICFLLSYGALQLDAHMHWASPFLGMGWATMFTAIMTLVPQTTLIIRRLHDANFSGWWSLATIVPVFGLLAVVVFATLPSTSGDNRFGAPRLA